MAATLQDVVSANLVLVGVGLLNEPAEVEQFRNVLDLDLRVEVGLVTNVSSGLTESSRTIMLNRERIALNLSSSRSSIACEYPEQSSLARLAQVAVLAIGNANLSGQIPQSFGYNIEMVFNQDTGQSAIYYLGERLFDYRLLKKDGWDLLGGRGQLIFRDAIGQWTVTVEPRFGDEATSRVFLSLNLHKNEQRLPEEDEIRGSLEEIWREALAFMERLDERGVS